MNIQRRKARSTGTIVTVLDEAETREYECDASAGKYGLICEPHGGFVCVPTLAVARAEAAHPEEWCPTCQEDAS